MNKKPNLTPWFKGKAQPARDGVYQRNYGDKKLDMDNRFCKFADGKWYWPALTAGEAAAERHTSMCPNLPWRGLATKKPSHG